MTTAKIGLFKRAWHEIPEVVGSSVMAVFGIMMAGYGLYHYHKIDGDKLRYKLKYTVMRDDDPRVKELILTYWDSKDDKADKKE